MAAAQRSLQEGRVVQRSTPGVGRGTATCRHAGVLSWLTGRHAYTTSMHADLPCRPREKRTKSALQRRFFKVSGGAAARAGVMDRPEAGKYFS